MLLLNNIFFSNTLCFIRIYRILLCYLFFCIFSSCTIFCCKTYIYRFTTIFGTLHISSLVYALQESCYFLFFSKVSFFVVYRYIYVLPQFLIPLHFFIGICTSSINFNDLINCNKFPITFLSFFCNHVKNIVFL